MSSWDNLTDYISELQETSVNIRDSLAPGIPSDIPDILDQAIKLLIPFIGKVSDSDLKASDSQSFNDNLEKREQKIMNLIHDSMLKISDKINALASRIEVIEGKNQKKVEQIRENNLKNLEEHQSEFSKQASDIQSEYNKKRQDIKDKEKELYERYESQLSKKLDEVSSELTESIKVVEDETNQSQQLLQETIHKKHKQASLRTDELRIEERRVASEHERISREYQVRKKQAEDEIRQYTRDIQTLEASIANHANSKQSELEQLEEQLLAQREELDNQHQLQLIEMDERIKKLQEEVTFKRNLLESNHSDSLIKISELKKDQEQSLNQELTTTQRLIAEGLYDIETRFVPIINQLNKEIEQIQQERGIAIEALRKDQQDAADSHAQVLIDLNKKLQDENVKYRAALKKEQQNLQELEAERDADLEDLRHSLQTKFGDKMSQYDENERVHAEEITRLMKMFEDQQAVLADIHRKSLENRDRHKAAEISRIEQEHEQRKKAVLLRIEQQEKAELERELNEASQTENDKHKREVTSINDRVTALKNRAEMLSLKIEGLYKINGQQLDQLVQNADETLAEDMQKIKKEGTSENVPNIRERLLAETQEVNRRKALVLKDADKVTEYINDLQARFERKMSQLESNYIKSTNQVKKQTRDADIRQSQLISETREQKEKIKELKTVAQDKTNEIDTMEANFEDNKAKFKEETKAHFEADLQEEKMKPSEVQAELDDLRKTLQDRIIDLQEQLSEARANTEKTSQLIMMERAQRLEETETMLRTEFEERMKVISEDNDEHLGAARKRRAEILAAHIQEKTAITHSYDEKMEENQKAFVTYRDELQEERENLEEEQEKLEKEVKELRGRECPDCIVKKETIIQLIAKEKEYVEILNKLKHTQAENEGKMNMIFGRKSTPSFSQNSLVSMERDKHLVRPRVSSPVTKTNRRSSLSVKIHP